MNISMDIYMGNEWHITPAHYYIFEWDIVSEVQDIFFKYFIEFKKNSLKRDSGTGAFLWILRNF